MPHVFDPPTQRWVCPNCNQKAVTHVSGPHTEFHHCGGLRGLIAPMTPEGAGCRVTAIPREDYVGNDIVQTDENGRPVMAIRTDYADGRNDIAILAPMAQGSISALL